MDIVILQASAYELPTSRRVGVIAHEGGTLLVVMNSLRLLWARGVTPSLGD
jgi:cation transport ATPase